VSEPGSTDAAVCSLCGTAAAAEDAAVALTWMRDTVETAAGPRTRWVCPDCTRRHVRAIEAKLEQEWW
jgi:hypothetical protein